jgi:hypothetical protein
MTAEALERLLARLYTDAQLRRRFVADREGVARAAALDADEVEAVLRLDADDLELAAESFAAKRAKGARSDRAAGRERP